MKKSDSRTESERLGDWEKGKDSDGKTHGKIPMGRREDRLQERSWRR